MLVYKGVYGFDGVFYSKWNPQFEYRVGKIARSPKGIYAVTPDNLSYALNFIGTDMGEQVTFLEMSVNKRDITSNSNGIVIASKALVTKEVPYEEFRKLIGKGRH